MRIARTSLRTAAAAAVAFLVAPAAPAAAGPVVVEQPFYADSGDPCPRGYTKGVLIWRAGAGIDDVDVVGEVVDRADPKNPACGDDRRYTIASYTVYEPGVPGGSEKKEVDNGTLVFSMPIDGNTTEAYIEHVTIQVCRAADRPNEPTICGKPQVYTSPF